MVVPGVGVEGAPGGDDPLLAVRLFLLSDFLFFLLARAPALHSPPLAPCFVPRPQPPLFSFVRARRVGLEAGREGSHPRKVWEQFWSGGEESPTSTGLQKRERHSSLPPSKTGRVPLPPYWHLAAWNNFGKSSRYVPGEEGKKDADQFKVPLKVFVPFIAPLYFAEYV